MDMSGLESACLGDVGTRIHTANTVCAACNWALYRSALMSAPVCGCRKKWCGRKRAMKREKIEEGKVI